MPTFIDAIDNFNSDAIREDTWVRQLSRAGKKVVFMGDDTWVSLFPDTFTRSYPFPSFDVKDLHTVDNGVVANLVPEIKKRFVDFCVDLCRGDFDPASCRNGDWDVIIGHFLGVDHVGHRLGSEHPEMAYKLMQMDGVLRDVKENIDDDTILLVFGDHGMTADGNHGGSTDLEVDSALFVYSKKQINSAKPTGKVPSIEDIQSVYQIDLVPTICSLLGAPIPFGNLGFVIPELLAQRNRNELDQADLISLQRFSSAAAANAEQVMRYLETYSATTRQFPTEDLKKVEELYLNAQEALKTQSQSKEHLIKAIEAFLEFHTVAIATCRKLWTTFDTVAMWIGILGGIAAAGSALVAALSTLDQLSSAPLAMLTLLGGIIGFVFGGLALGFASSAVPSLLGLSAIGSAFFFTIVSGLLKPVILGALELLFPSHFASNQDADGAIGRKSPPRARASSAESGDFGSP
jgi:GPI ethanolamine phosphate transferase 3 subunit O